VRLCTMHNCTFTNTLQVLPVLTTASSFLDHSPAISDPNLQQSNEQCDETSSSLQTVLHTVNRVCASPWHESDKRKALCGSRVSSRCTTDRLNPAP
jgi:hypothetical protein